MIVEGRNTSGQFSKGNTGGGRLGTGINQTAKKLLTDSSEAITRKVIALALEGDTSMLKLCMDKLLPQASLIQQQLQEQIEALEVAHANTDQ